MVTIASVVSCEDIKVETVVGPYVGNDVVVVLNISSVVSSVGEYVGCDVTIRRTGVVGDSVG